MKNGNKRRLSSSLCILAVLAFSLSACGNKGREDTPGGGSGQAVESTADTPETAQETEESLPETSEGIGEAATEESNPELTDPEAGSGWSEEMESLKAAVVEVLGDRYWPNAPLSKEVVEGTFGVAEELYDDYMAEAPLISVNVDTLVIVKAKAGKEKEAEEALSAYRASLVESTTQYPRNIGKIQASRVEAIGAYVCFVQLGADAPEDTVDVESAMEKCAEQNELAIEALKNAIEG
ncbi:MAG: DUF4358 domain-containing protein [Clostridium sp.]|jgi:predicted small lipoprotein YifL|nr:DUF4358 domain-containing protein [Clostridium sp.]